MRIAFLTATPLNIVGGSGTYAGLSALAGGLRTLGAEVEIIAPSVRLPNFTLQRLYFNEQLRQRLWDGFDLLVGFDMDGYRIAGRTGRLHIASIKGVIADEMRFERGPTRLSMSVQAACEKQHVQRADQVITTSRYAAGRLQELYGLRRAPVMLPELIDLDAWRALFARNPARPDPSEFTVLTVCRLYPRKRLHLLLEAAICLRNEIPGLRLRIVGDGPEHSRLHTLWRKNRLEGTILWLGNLSQDDLAREYNRCDIFCLPSVQEGFGIVFLEAMAAAKPIVATGAAAIPEVVKDGLLVEPESADALAEAIARLYRDPGLRSTLRSAGARNVAQYHAPCVAQRMLDAIKVG